MLKKSHNRIFVLLTLGMVILFFFCGNKESGNCEQFKNGKFIFHLRLQNGEVFFTINRKDSIQMETDNHAGYYSKLLVKWTDKCKYETTLLETTFPFSDSIQKIRKTIPLKTEIISCTNDYYVFKTHRGNSPTMTDTMWVDK